jgi:hypothetical protein
VWAIDDFQPSTGKLPVILYQLNAIIEIVGAKGESICLDEGVSDISFQAHIRRGKTSTDTEAGYQLKM